MSQMVDDELLEGEDDDDGYDITTEREEVLLQDDEDFPKGGGQYENLKKSSYSDTDDADDVLNLHVDEDFQDDDKLLDDEEEECDKERFNKMANTNEGLKERTRSRSPPNKTFNQNKNKDAVLAVKNLNTVHQKANKNQQNRRPMRNEKWRRRNVRGMNQTNQRTNFVKNNAPRRRNGTVLINPRYEGTVRINDNNARLAWDNNPQYPQNNSSVVQPWNGNVLGSANLIVSNLVSGLANSLAQHSSPNILMSQQTNQNFYEPPPTVNFQTSNNYDPPLAFEPPPHIVEESCYPEPYSNQTQLVNPPLLPSPPQVYSRDLSPQGYSRDLPPQAYSRDFPPPMNHPPPMRMQNTSNSFSNCNSYHLNSSPVQSKKFSNTTNSYNANLNRYNSGSSDYNTYQQNNYASRSLDYSEYSVRENSYDYNSSYENQGRTNSNMQNMNYRQNQTNTSNSKFQNNSSQQYQNKNNQQRNNNYTNRPNNFSLQGGKKTTLNVVNRKGNWRLETFNSELSDVKNEVLETKPKTENTNQEKTNVEEKSKTVSEEEEDEETRLYRLKIEEQKRERERILKLKEERRRQMILQKEEQEKKKLPSVLPTKPSQDNIKNNNPNISQLVRKNNDLTSTTSAQKPNQTLPPLLKQPAQTQTFTSTSLNVGSDLSDMSNLTFKVSNNRQPTNPSVNQVQKSESSSGGFMSNRVIIVKSKNSQKIDNPKPVIHSDANTDTADVGQGLSSFFNNRKVLKKDNSLLNTRLVIVNNLSSSINQDKLMALCHGIGEIQQLRVDKQERQATILFKSVASAHAFFKKYQRRILDDLSVIEVKLEPMI